MKRKTLALAHTRIRCTLALNVQVQRDGIVNLIVLPLVGLTGLVWLAWSAWLLVGRQWGLVCSLAGVAVELVVALIPLYWVTWIVIKSLVWGVGLRF